MSSKLAFPIALLCGLLVGTGIPFLAHFTGVMHYQRCEAMGFKTGSIENNECVRILSRVPSEYQRELLDSLRGNK